MGRSHARGRTGALTLDHTNYRHSQVVSIFAYLGPTPEPQLPRNSLKGQVAGYGVRVEVDVLLRNARGGHQPKTGC